MGYLKDLGNAIIGRQVSKVVDIPESAWITIGGSGRRNIDQGSFDTFTATQLAEVYSKSSLVYACCNELASTIAEAPLEVGRFREDDTWEKVNESH